MNLLALHELISATGDGLHPDLLRLFEERARLESEPSVATLSDHAPGMPVQSGPSPAGKPGLFVAGNIVRFAPAAAAVASPSIASKKA